MGARKKSPNLNTELLAAAEAGDKATVAKLLSQGADANARDDDDVPVLELACWSNELEIAEMLLDAGADVNGVNSYSDLAIVAAMDNENLPLMKLLIERGTNVHHQSDDQMKHTLLTRALDPREVEKPSPAVLGVILRAGLDPNVPNGEDFRALQFAAEHPNVELTDVLLEAGAKVDAVDTLGRTALMVAAGRGHTDVMKRLIEAGANVDFQMADNEGNTVLLSILEPNEVREPSEKGVAALLEAGADPNLPSKTGWTALHCAAHFSAPKIVELLVKAGADMTVSRKGTLAIDVARKLGHDDVVAKLRELSSSRRKGTAADE